MDQGNSMLLARFEAREFGRIPGCQYIGTIYRHDDEIFMKGLGLASSIVKEDISRKDARIILRGRQECREEEEEEEAKESDRGCTASR